MPHDPDRLRNKTTAHTRSRTMTAVKALAIRVMPHDGETRRRRSRRRHHAMRDNAHENISDAAEPSVARTTPSYSPQVNGKNPGSTDASCNRSAPAAPPNRWRRPLLILGPVVLIVGALVL